MTWRQCRVHGAMTGNIHNMRRRILLADANHGLHDVVRRAIESQLAAKDGQAHVEASQDTISYDLTEAASAADAVLRVESAVKAGDPVHMVLMAARLLNDAEAFIDACRQADPYVAFGVLIDESTPPPTWDDEAIARTILLIRPPHSERDIRHAAALMTELSHARRKAMLVDQQIEHHVTQRTRQIDDARRHLGEAVKELELAQAAAQAANRARSQFLATVSHEVRTPLNGIIGMADLLIDVCEDDDQRHCLTTIQQSGQSLLQIFTDMLDLSRLESGHLKLRSETLPLRTIVTETIRLISAQAQSKGLMIMQTLRPDVPTHVRGDAAYLRQVLVKLIGNAVKFTERGGVHVLVSCPEQNDRDALIRVDIKDTGIGINPAHVEMLFSAFEQADGSATRKYGGTGLGLPIARQLARLMGGDVTVASQLGAGSTFTFTARLPLFVADAASAQPQCQATRTATQNPSRDLHVLLVEDSDVSRVVASRMLVRMGCKVDAVNSGAQAVQQCLETDFDLVLMDLEMPGMSGIQASVAIRQQETRRHVPIVALTAHALEAHRRECLEAGMDDFMTKPITMDRIREVLCHWADAKSDADHDSCAQNRETTAMPVSQP
ncbi:MAG: response regulator [Phycisphaeraceae bacterium]|nr:response regulator [Phycisphaeraceae bacterium]